MLSTNLAFLRIAKRAEKEDEDILQKTFVDFGSILTVVNTVDHQVIFGRRGTGKTHLLTKLKRDRTSNGLVTVQVDMQNLGSPGGVYSDSSVPLPERGTRLLIDFLATVHSKLLEQCHSGIIVGESLVEALDEFFDAHASVAVVGETTIESSASAETAINAEAKLGITASSTPNMSVNVGASSTEKDSVSAKKTVKGKEILKVNFGEVSRALAKLVAQLPSKSLWILVDEWSEVPLDLQPFVADMLKRALLQIKGVTVKIAAIEHRTNFLIIDSKENRIGLELGADSTVALNLDEYMVFENDESAAIAFFRKLVFSHVKSALEVANREINDKEERMKEQGEAIDTPTPRHQIPSSEKELLSLAFTQSAVFDEVVRACEGVPRDAINILSHAAQRANTNVIQMDVVRQSARKWYQSSKEAVVGANSLAKELLKWIKDEVIDKRHARAFLLLDGTKDQLIDILYDLRVLHLIRNGISSQDSPGDRFNVYAIDYGCYINLVNTAGMPRGLLDVGDKSSDMVSEVPVTDFRSIRRCVLKLQDFYQHISQQSANQSSASAQSINNAGTQPAG